MGRECSDPHRVMVRSGGPEGASRGAAIDLAPPHDVRRRSPRVLPGRKPADRGVQSFSMRR